MIPSTIPQAAWWPLVGAALAHMLGDPDDEQRCRRAAIRALTDTGMPQLPAAHLLTLHTWDAEQAGKTLAAELTAWLLYELPTTQQCTGAHKPGPRRIANQYSDWCVWCDAPIPLDGDRRA